MADTKSPPFETGGAVAEKWIAVETLHEAPGETLELQERR